jgi:rSAM/selenodomain-associated transferase 2
MVTVPRLSIVIPALNEGAALPRLLDALAPLRDVGCEVVVADGGSSDGTAEAARDRVDRVVVTEPGRAHQMNEGAAAATGARLWFLHADSRPPAGAPGRIEWGLARRAWGRFDVALSGGGLRLAVVAAMMNRRSCWTGICTGDQGLFITRAGFEAVGGFPEQPLMEDVAFSRRAKRYLGRPACVPGPLVTSSRRWERDGIARTVLLMWRLRAAYALGASPAVLHHRYYGKTVQARENSHGV